MYKLLFVLPLCACTTAHTPTGNTYTSSERTTYVTIPTDGMVQACTRSDCGESKVGVKP